MEYLKGQQKEEAVSWINEAIEIAQQATCERARCGAIIIKDGEIIGKGFNSPPGDVEAERRCEIKKNTYDQKVTDKTCCIHAEQRAIINALHNNPKKIKGAQLYFARFYPNGERRLMGGATKMYCTICTKMMLDVGIAEFILAHQDGICVYTASEANQASFSYGK
jgi:deoxycytidylate deaminase